MRIFIVGASGYVGGHLVRSLVHSGYEVAALARSGEAACRITALGARVCAGDLSADDMLSREHERADAIIYVAQFPSVSEERSAIEAGLRRIAGSGKTFVMTSGTGVLCRDPGGVWSAHIYAEDDPFEPHELLKSRVDLEQQVRHASTQGIRSIVIRPPQVYGHGGSVALPQIIARARELGFVPYIGQGLNIWSNVHIDGLVDLYVRALERGKSGALYHAVGGEHCERHLAESVGAMLCCPARSISVSDVSGPYSALAGCSSRSQARRSQAELGWRPSGPDIFSDIATGSYSELQNLDGQRWGNRPG